MGGGDGEVAGGDLGASGASIWVQAWVGFWHQTAVASCRPSYLAECHLSAEWSRSSDSAGELRRRPADRRRPRTHGGADPGSVDGLLGDVTAEEQEQGRQVAGAGRLETHRGRLGEGLQRR